MWRAVPGGAVRAPGHLPRPQVLGLQLPLTSSGCCADPLRGRSAELEAVRRRAGQFLLTARLDIIHGARVLHRFDSDEALI